MPKKGKKGKGQPPKGARKGYQEFTKEELSGSRPPAWAKGRMIGIWHSAKNAYRYANRESGQEKGDTKRMKQLTKMKKVREPKCIPLHVPPEKISEVQEMLKKIGVPAPPCVQTTRSGNIQDRYKNVEDSAFKSKFLRSLSGNIQDRITTTKTCSLKKDPTLDERYMTEERSKMTNGRYREMLAFRKKLPAWSKSLELLDALDRNNVILVTGETGCGKTTQVAQFILEDAILAGRGSQTNIMCTQPRRISAITVAERVANERGERLGLSVGYQIRLEKVMPRSSASILYCTTGVLLQYMHGDPLLTKVSTVIVDEIHERNTISDFVITLLKDVVPLRPDLKVILMSATLNADRFSKYFNNCPTVHIPGFTFAVEEYYLEDILEEVPFTFPQSTGAKMKRAMKELSTDDSLFMEAYYRDLEHSGKYSRKTVDSIKNPESNEISLQLIANLVQHICNRMGTGAILVFLPGWDKISAINKLLTQSGKFPPSRYRIIPLHSLMPTANQKKVFERPPRGMRKIVLATNIAETSITIDDVVYVIDCGKIKIKNFDVDGNVSTLKEEWVSLANARQRKGRAGRVQEGVCFHMYSRGREMLLQKDMLPEILRTRLEEVILQGKILQVGKIGPFLGKVMDPPLERAVELSLNLLTSMNALDSEENLTPLGFHLASLPIDPQAGKMLLFASLFSILDPITSIAAALSYKDPFVIPMGQEREVDKVRQSFDAGHSSDHLILSKVIAQYEKANCSGNGWSYANSNFMSQNVLEQLRDMKKQFCSLLHDMKFARNDRVNSEENNVNTNNISLVRAIVCAGLFPNVAIINKCKKVGKVGRLIVSVSTIDSQKVNFHPKSIFAAISDHPSPFVVYFEKLKSTQIFLYDSTLVFPMALIFFSHDIQVFNKVDYKVIKLEENLFFRCSNELAALIVELRAWLDWLLEYKMCHPGVTDWGVGSDESLILKAVIDLIANDEATCLKIKVEDDVEEEDDRFEQGESDGEPSDDGSVASLNIDNL